MKKYDVIGLMSGTSLDGLDIAHVEFTQGKDWRFKIIHTNSKSYDDDFKNRLKHAYKLSALELKSLDIEYGKWIGKTVKEFMDFHQCNPDLIVSHGHTIFHQPQIGLTLQIGDGYQIMNATGIQTICDLRSLDIANGGQGAPLVPMGDKYLFSDYDICLNLGGFSNISFDKNENRIAYDICPVNTVLNYLSSKLNFEYDNNGDFARSGKTDNDLLSKLNTLEYYNQNPPKSLGIEWVVDHIFPLIHEGSILDLLNTYCHHIAFQIIASIKKNCAFDLKTKKPKMLVTGGGAKNKYLIMLMKNEVNNQFDIIIPEDQIVDFKEAVIFAFLGLLRQRGEINTLKSVTGAEKDSSGGLIYK